MGSTLKDLQLVPTGSLVLKKVQTPQVTDTGQWVTIHVGHWVSYHSNMGSSYECKLVSQCMNVGQRLNVMYAI